MLGINTATVLAGVAAWLTNLPRVPVAALPDRDPRQISKARRRNAHRRRRK